MASVLNGNRTLFGWRGVTRCALCMHRYKHGTEYAHMIAHTIAHYEELPDEVKSAIALGCTNLAPWKAQLLKLWPGRRREDGLSRLMSSAK